MGIDKVSVHDTPEAGTVLAAADDGNIELVLAPQDAARQVAYLVSGLHGTAMWQILDLQNLVEGAEVRIITSLRGATIADQTFRGRPVVDAPGPDTLPPPTKAGSEGDTARVVPAPPKVVAPPMPDLDSATDEEAAKKK